MPPAPIVRPAREDDAAAIAAVVVDALSDKYGPALGRAAVRGVEGLVRRDIREVSSSRYWVAEVEGRVAGGVHLALADDRGAGALQALAAEVGWARALRAVAVFSLLGTGRVARDEGYIDELGVAEWARRRGVASALLSACEREARRVGKRRLTLWVTADNRAARPLYERYGFREAARRRWVLGRAGVRRARGDLHGAVAPTPLTTSPGTGSAARAGAAGSSRRARPPGPGSRVRRPPRRSARTRATPSPRPAPGNPFAPSPRPKGSTAAPSSSPGMPGPVSLTASSTPPPGSARPEIVIVPPRGVKVAELAISSDRISCTSTESVCIGGSAAGRSVSRRRPRSRSF